YLSMLGYDLIVDGHFGNKTLRSLKAFQKKYGLAVDGVAGPQTFSALKAAQKRTSKEEKEVKYSGKNYGDLNVDTNHNQPAEQYLKQTTEKDKIFIHYTVSGPDAKSVLKYWDGNSERVSTAFVISGRGVEDGKIYEAFNPDYWSFHLGVKGTKGRLDKSSVGIEICAWGRIDKKGDKFYNAYGGEVPANEVYTLKDKWRGNLYFHAYSDKQLESLEKLLMWIINEYNIPVQNIEFNKDWAEYNEKVMSEKSPGIWTHTNVRLDKQDTYPDQRIFDLLNRIKTKING
ncbi:MAG: peptidoglycan-binding protein, partial [Nanoarchaeota archaeon]